MKRSSSSRNGKARRRRLEFETIRYHVQRDKLGFVRRLASRLSEDGQGCLVYRATKTPEGYPNITFRFRGKHVVMKVHRVFGILMNCAPIPLGFDVGHKPGCHNRACVLHIALQHNKENAAASCGGLGGVPF